MDTILGFLAIIFWGTGTAFARSIIEQLGPFTAGASIFLLGGTLGCTFLTLTGRNPFKLLHLPVSYLFGCGSLFVVYMLLIYSAIGLASNRLETIGVSIVNFLWPGLILVFSIPILKKRAKISLVPGILIALVGVFLATSHGGSFSWTLFAGNIRSNPAPYILALTAANLWAVYSNLSRKLAGDTKGGSIPVFILAVGLVMFVLRWVVGEQSHWQLRTVLEILYMAVFPALLSYIFWDRAMRKGHMTLVASFSYLGPVLSTLVICLYLRVSAGLNLWIAAILVVVGAVICKYSIIENGVGK